MEEVIKEILQDAPVKIIISNPKSKQQEFRKIVIRPIIMKQEKMYQCEKFTKQQVFHVNVKEYELESIIISFMEDFKQCDIFMVKETILLKVCKIG